MKYERKTEDEFQIHGLYNGQWEEVTCEVTRSAARDNLKAYRASEPGVSFKMVKRRVKIISP